MVGRWEGISHAAFSTAAECALSKELVPQASESNPLLCFKQLSPSDPSKAAPPTKLS
jgi:hypothetical protein